MYKFWEVHGTQAEYVFLTATAKCETEEDVRVWMKVNHPRIDIESITEDKGN